MDPNVPTSKKGGVGEKGSGNGSRKTTWNTIQESAEFDLRESTEFKKERGGNKNEATMGVESRAQCRGCEHVVASLQELRTEVL